MKYIDRSHLSRLVETDKLDELDQAKAELLNKSPEERKQFIKDNADKCTAIKPALWQLGCGKCWYSEAEIQVNEGQIEHYRPKNQVWKTSDLPDGYWWLAFDIENLMLAHSTCNMRKSDYLKKIKCGKGCYFPLKPGSQRAQNPGDEGLESPLLLNPTEPNDVKLITFDPSSGKPIVNEKNISEDWDRERVNKTVDYYHLDEGTWNRNRKNIFVKSKKIREKLEKYDPGSTEYSEALEEATIMLSPWSKFSTVIEHAFIINGIYEKVS